MRTIAKTVLDAMVDAEIDGKKQSVEMRYALAVIYARRAMKADAVGLSAFKFLIERDEGMPNQPVSGDLGAALSALSGNLQSIPLEDRKRIQGELANFFRRTKAGKKAPAEVW